MHWVDWAIMLVPLLMVLGMAFYSGRYVRGVADFLAAGRVAGDVWRRFDLGAERNYAGGAVRIQISDRIRGGILGKTFRSGWNHFFSDRILRLPLERNQSIVIRTIS